jgi:hypothetical protein
VEKWDPQLRRVKGVKGVKVVCLFVCLLFLSLQEPRRSRANSRAYPMPHLKRSASLSVTEREWEGVKLSRGRERC